MKRKHMNHIQDIIQRLQLGESERRIALDMNISRATVHKYHGIAKEKGYLEKVETKPSDGELKQALGPGVQAPKQVSTVEPYREAIKEWMKQGVEITAIWLRLQENFKYAGGYSSVRRFVHRLEPVEPEVFIRVQSEPGEDMQVDFGTVGQLFDPVTKRMRTAYVFVATLCYSRHQYAELVFDQKVATWLALHKRAFAFFGGVPKRIIPDNLKSAVVKALVHDPILGEAYRRMALHYGFLISPTIPHTPRHKGKVESGVHYVKRNFFAGQEFLDINMGNVHLRNWIMNTAGVRKHGTTSEAPLHLFNTIEKDSLQPITTESFRLLEIRPVKVHPDCHVVITGSYYSVPFKYVGEELAAHVSENFIEIYNKRQDLVTTHPRSTRPGQWHTRLEDYPAAKAAYLIHTPDYCKKQGAKIGPSTQSVVEQLLADRPLDRLRSVQAILKLEESVGPKRLEDACTRAAYFGDVRYRQIKLILNAALDREPLPEVQPAQPALNHAFARSGEEFFGRRS
ncbi:MAG: IS21 family transposase [Methylococcales bacterium]|nr:MAG: IS21 family transposase [Methylococcales bacterium]